MVSSAQRKRKMAVLEETFWRAVGGFVVNGHASRQISHVAKFSTEHPHIIL